MNPDSINEAEQVRERRRILQRQRRAAMNEEQIQLERERRRRTYLLRTSSIENEMLTSPLPDMPDPHLNNQTRIRGSVRLTHVRRLARNPPLVFSHSEASTSGTSNIENEMLTSPLPYMPDPHLNNQTWIRGSVRLTHVRRLARNPPLVFSHSEASTSGTSNRDNNELHGQLGGHQRRYVTYNNYARNFQENPGFVKYQVPITTICKTCQAKLFKTGTLGLCCRNGSIVLPEIPVPEQLLSLVEAQTREGRLFRQNIRSYNHVFAFTSMGVSLDEKLENARGVYTFRAHGSIYHRIGSLLPNPGDRPRFLQLYIYDTEHETDNRLLENESLDRNLLDKIKQILDGCNPFVSQFRQLGHQPELENCTLVIKEQTAERRQYSLPTCSQVVAILVGLDDVTEVTTRDIVVQTIGGRLLNVKEYSGYYDPLQYPLLLPFGTYGWDKDYMTSAGRKVSSCDYYSFMLQIRRNPSILLRAGRLLQQYAVDSYVKIETGRLRWISTHQKDIRAELYQGLQDCLNVGENNAGNVGEELTILPSSFTGGHRDMYQCYLDAMAVVQKYGKPDLFVTMTCNPQWEEIKRELLLGQTPQDLPDLLTRVFRAKFEELKVDLFTRNILGKVVAHVHVIEFQKRGLPHSHLLIILDENDKLKTPDDYDQIVRAEIPYSDGEPMLYNTVMRHMIHGPYGPLKPRSPCMKNGKCKKDYPKRFCQSTIQGNDFYPIYRRRDHRLIALDSEGEMLIDNSWVVPYNPWLLLKYDCHINVEVCSSVKSVKYLYKYVYKGPDCVTFELRPGSNNDEVKKFVDGWWICAPEALWRIFQFPISKIYPSVERLHIHLPNMQQVRFFSHQTISEVVTDPCNSRTMLTEFFKIYGEELEQTKYLYRELPEHYIWISQQKIWERRVRRMKSIGRVYSMSPLEGESFYLRLLLNHVRGPKSFDDLLTVHRVHYLTFKQAAEEHGLLEADDSISHSLAEAHEIQMPRALRRLFATILIYTNPCNVRRLWDENFSAMVEDYPNSSDNSIIYIRNKLLSDISKLLEQHNKKLREFDLPPIIEDFVDLGNISSIVDDELAIPVSNEDQNCVQMLNAGQLGAFNTIKEAIEEKQNQIFFVDGPGGTGKTFLYRALLSHFRAQ